MPVKSLRPLRPDAFDYRKAQHLLNRAGFGGSPAEIRALAGRGLEASVDSIVDYLALDDPAPVRADDFDKDIMQPLSAKQRRELRRARRSGDEAAIETYRQHRQDAQRADRQQMRDIRHWWLGRMIETPRPLEEKMTLFWHGHFATSYRAIEDSYHLFLQNQLFRTHAVGNFKSLAHAIIRDPAMLRYLDNNRNRRASPNENLARELMELFTLGEGHGYTERDIREGARALTGWTYVDDEFIDLDSRHYRRAHDDGPKRILGRSGRFDGDDFVDLIFDRRACSEFICFKLYRFFVHDVPGGEPDEAQREFIVELARHLRQQHYQLRPVLRTLFLSAHFYDQRNVGAQVKSPVQLIVQLIRSLGTPPRHPGALLRAAALMGQDLFSPPSVRGWAGGRSWINTSTLFVRQNVAVYLLTGRRPDAHRWRADAEPFDAAHLVEALPPSAAAREAAEYLLRINLAAPPHRRRVASLVEFLEGRPLRNDVLIALLSLITAMPEYQLC